MAIFRTPNFVIRMDLVIAAKRSNLYKELLVWYAGGHDYINAGEISDKEWALFCDALGQDYSME